MLIIFHILLVLNIGRCTDDHIFETKTVGVGQNVTLTCTRQTSWRSAYLFWIRLVSGTFPEFLGGTLAYDLEVVEQTRHITAKQEPGTFVLHITKTQLSDTAVYYCIKVKNRSMTFLKGIFLRIKGPEPDITAVVQDFPSDPVRPGDSVTLQCSVLSDSDNKTCPGDHSVYWFRAGSDESHPSLIYAQRNNSDECEKRPEAQSPQKCVYKFFKNVSSSDAGTYYCAVATCGEILFGNGAKLDIEDNIITAVSNWDLQKANTLLFLLCAVLAISLIVITLLIYTIKKKSCDCCNVAVVLQTNAETANGDQQSRQKDEASLVYSAPTFIKRKVGKAERRNAKAPEREIVYSDVRAFGLD